MKFDGDNYRSYKVSSLIKKELGQIFITLQNDLLKKIIIKDVEMSRDLSQAKIFFDFFCDEFHFSYKVFAQIHIRGTALLILSCLKKNQKVHL